MAVVGRQLLPQPAQIHHRIEPAHQMIGGNKIIKAILVEKLFLIPIQPPHHRSVLPQITKKTESQDQISSKMEFRNSIRCKADINNAKTVLRV
jgi:hypothetical protein